MDQATLVTEEIEEGRRLIKELRTAGVPVVAAAWVKSTEGGLWYLHLVTPLLSEDRDPRSAYGRIREVIRGMSEPLGIDPLQISLVGPWQPVGRAIVDFGGQQRGRIPIRRDAGWLGDQPIEGAYIYPQSVFTAGG